jgi:hypothetical protein
VLTRILTPTHVFFVKVPAKLSANDTSHLKQMIQDDVTDRARLVAETAVSLGTKIFGHIILHAFDVVPVPERFHERVCETEYDHILHRRLPLARL